MAKTLKFRQQLIQEVLSGRKTSTWRLFDDKDLQVGDKLELLDWETKEKFTEVKIVNVRIKKLGEIKDEDFESHEKYNDQDGMLKHYKKYYGDKVTLDTPVKMIDFKPLHLEGRR